MSNPETTLQATLAATAKQGVSTTPKYQNGTLIHVPLTALKDNPYQPRTHLDETALQELIAAIKSQGLLQAIAVRPHPDGTFTIVAGHRRSEAFRRLHADATTDAERKKYETIPALVMLALDNAQLAVRAYQENVARSALTALDEAMALERMFAEGLVTTNDALSELTGQPLPRIKRLRRLAQAPTIVKDGVSKGVSVVVETTADGKERREVRRLDLMAALSFQRLWEHLAKDNPKKADERTGAALKRSLEENWGKKRVEDYVAGVLDGSDKQADSPSEPSPSAAVPLFTRTAKRFVVEIPKGGKASPSKVTELKKAIEALLVELSGSPTETAHR